MKRPLLILCVALMCVSTSAHAQSMYDEDLLDLSARLRSVMVDIEQNLPARQINVSKMQSDLLILSKRLHRLQEEAMKADAVARAAGRPPNRQLAFAVAVSEQLDASQMMLSLFLDTKDKSLWEAAINSAKSARDLMASQ